jgi:hypothetical protein
LQLKAQLLRNYGSLALPFPLICNTTHGRHYYSGPCAEHFISIKQLIHGHKALLDLPKNKYMQKILHRFENRGNDIQ